MVMRDDPIYMAATAGWVQPWRARYGLAEGDAWTDAHLEAMLFDCGFPVLSALPGEPQGMALAFAAPPPLAADPAHYWRRLNALHLFAHAILHDGARCDTCEGW